MGRAQSRRLAQSILSDCLRLYCTVLYDWLIDWLIDWWFIHSFIPSTNPQPSTTKRSVLLNRHGDPTVCSPEWWAGGADKEQMNATPQSIISAYHYSSQGCYCSKCAPSFVSFHVVCWCFHWRRHFHPRTFSVTSFFQGSAKITLERNQLHSLRNVKLSSF